MSEEEKHNDSIESFFEEKVSNYTIPYEERDWEKLEERLDKVNSIYHRRRRNRMAAAIAALLIGILAYFTYQNHTQLNRLNDQLSEQEVTQPKSRDAGQPPSATKGTPPQESPNVASSGDTQTQRNNDPGKSFANSQVNQSHAEQNKHRLGATGTAAHNAFSAWTISTKETQELFISEVTCEICQSSLESSGEALNKTIIKAPSTQRIASVASVQNSGQPGAGQIHTQKKSNVTMGLVMAPDLSTVGGLSNFENPGYKIGVTVEINLSNRLSVSSGVIHSTVHYQAQGREYNPPTGYWGEGIIADQTFAECALLDIPLNLKYKVTQRGRSSVYATVGISSYIMLTEDYQFQYGNYANNLPEEWSEKTGTRHLFSNASLSMGYEWALRSNWGLQIEPFIKLPLREVGWGNVKLYSIGTFISLNYKL